MKLNDLHAWKMTPKEAVDVQRNLCDRVVERPFDLFGDGRENALVAAADVSADRFSPFIHAAVVVMRVPGFEVVETRTASGRAQFPYVPGLLSFRELPALRDAFESLEMKPDVVLCDGHGRAHPRRFGLACHAGLLTGLPTVGCAKSPLVGSFTDPATGRGSRSDMLHDGEVIGAVLRTRAGVNPVFVSVGHLVDLDSAVRTVLECAPRLRIPEPLRAAHNAANDARRNSLLKL